MRSTTKVAIAAIPVLVAVIFAIYSFRHSHPESAITLSPSSEFPRILETGNSLRDPKIVGLVEMPYDHFHELWRSTPRHRASTRAVAWNRAWAPGTAVFFAVGIEGGALQSFDLLTGKFRWRIQTHFPKISEPVSETGERLLFGETGTEGSEGALTAIDDFDGTPLWRLRIPGPLRNAIEIRDDNEGTDLRTIAFFSAGRAGTAAVSTLNGRVMWRQPIGVAEFSPNLNGNELWVQSQSTEPNPKTDLFLLNPKSGEYLWNQKLEGTPWGAAVKLRGSTFALTRQGDKTEVHKVETNKGIAWSVGLTGTVIPQIASDPLNGQIILTTEEGKITALNGHTGQVAWTFELDSPTFTEAVFSRNIPLSERPLETLPGERRDLGALVVAQGRSGQIVILEPKSGALLKTLRGGPDSRTPPVIENDRLLIISPTEISAYGGLSKLVPKSQ